MRSADRRLGLGALALAFAGLTGLVQTGVTAGIDHFALRSLQPLTGTDWSCSRCPPIHLRQAG